VRAIRAAKVFTDGAFADDRAVVVEGADLQGVDSPPKKAEDWGDVAILPGAVNAHGHAFQNLLKGFADDRPFESWRDDVLYPFSERLDSDAIYWGSLFAFAEALLAGTTTTADFFYLHDEGNDNAKRVIQAAKDIGIRLVLARALYDPDAPTKAPARYREPYDESLARLTELADEYQDDPLISIQPAPHSLHAASLETIAAALAWAKRYDAPCHLHLAEARYELDQITARHGTTPVRLLEREGLLDPHLVAIHAVWIDDEELDMLADANVGIVHCPGANAFLGDGIAKVPEMLRRGIRVALGPDGGCANNRQSTFEEMRTAGLMAKARLLDGEALDARAAFRMGTLAGAELLGLKTGALEAGAAADLIALDLNDLSLQPLGTLERQVVNSMQPTAIQRVMVGGEEVVEGGRLTKVDAKDIREAVGRVTADWTRP
jgi:5-methylthioadenosine/S-adenosylhomocysteine deaminase